MPNAYTVICTLRQNVYWQNIAPAYGRQLVSSDIVAHYNRLLGLGGGFTKDPYYVAVTGWNPAFIGRCLPINTPSHSTGSRALSDPTSILTIMEAAGADVPLNAPMQ